MFAKNSYAKQNINIKDGRPEFIKYHNQPNENIIYNGYLNTK